MPVQLSLYIENHYFDFLNPPTDISGYFNLWDIFSIQYYFCILNYELAKKIPEQSFYC